MCVVYGIHIYVRVIFCVFQRKELYLFFQLSHENKIFLFRTIDSLNIGHLIL